MKFVLILLCCVVWIQGSKRKHTTKEQQKHPEAYTNPNIDDSNTEEGPYNLFIPDLGNAGFITKEKEELKLYYNKTPVQKEKTNSLDDEGISPQHYYELRSAEVASLRNVSQDGLYSHKFNITLSLPEFLETYNHLMAGSLLANVTVSIAGRIVDIRKSGANLIYYDLKCDDGVVQILATRETDESAKIRRGDIIGCTGHPGVTKKGKLSVVPKYLELLAPCLHKLPKSINNEVRYRKRYLDLIFNDKSKRIYKTRAEIISYIRGFLDNRGFLEVETPILQPIPGGAVAKPFKTHFDSLNIDYFLRIAPELYHKMLVVGGMEKVYEIGRQLRNEKVDSTHNPEFTSVEFYMAYADYYDLFKITEELISGLVKKIQGSYKVNYHPNGPSGEELEINFEPPFARIPVIPTLEKLMNVTFPPADTFHTPAGKSFLRQLCEKHEIKVAPSLSSSKLLGALIGKFLQVRTIQPTFIVDYPQIMSPLAKEHRDHPGLTERFELFVMQKEVCNAYTEQNDPIAQRAEMVLQNRDRIDGDDEIPPIDNDFITALEYGLPPTAGWGLGVERITMLLTDSQNIKEVILFPAAENKP